MKLNKTKPSNIFLKNSAIAGRIVFILNLRKQTKNFYYNYKNIMSQHFKATSLPKTTLIQHRNVLSVLAEISNKSLNKKAIPIDQ